MVIISHDPARTDEQLTEIEHYLQTSYGKDVRIECGKEGRVFEF